MITLNEYKDELINKYKYEIDNSEEKINIRKQYLNRSYSDEYLNKIINDTYKVIKEIFETIETSFYYINMDDDTTSYISLNLTGGYFSDRLYIDPYGNIISEHILRRTFGNRLIVELENEELKFTDDDIVGYDYSYRLYLQGFPDNMKQIKDSLYGISKIR